MSVSEDAVDAPQSRLPLGLTGYQWTVLFAAWLGWGFDVFDGLLFNFVSTNAVPVLLHLTPGTKETLQATLRWTAYATSILLAGWGIGGLLFGRIADRIGRSKTLLLTMLLYAAGTAACALAPNMAWLIVFRIVASLGIGGEWAAGCSLVAEVVPEKRRVEAGALLYTSAAGGLFLALVVNKLVSQTWLLGHPEYSWRWVLAFGLLPAAFAFVVRSFVKEPERWKETADQTRGNLAELFKPEYRKLTLSGFIPALFVLITWWSCNSFIQVIASDLAIRDAGLAHLTKLLTNGLKQDYIWKASTAFNLGGLIGTLLTIPAAKYSGRRPMFAIYLLLSGAAITFAFGRPWPSLTQLWLYFPIGLTVFGVFGSFTYYLPELFPTRLRATGSGFCYNVGRLITVAGPIWVASYAAQGASALDSATKAIFYIGFVPWIGLLFTPLIIETRGKTLEA
jgi:MFS family permease